MAGTGWQHYHRPLPALTGPFWPLPGQSRQCLVRPAGNGQSGPAINTSFRPLPASPASAGPASLTTSFRPLPAPAGLYRPLPALPALIPPSGPASQLASQGRFWLLWYTTISVKPFLFACCSLSSDWQEAFAKHSQPSAKHVPICWYLLGRWLTMLDKCFLPITRQGATSKQKAHDGNGGVTLPAPVGPCRPKKFPGYICSFVY